MDGQGCGNSAGAEVEEGGGSVQAVGRDGVCLPRPFFRPVYSCWEKRDRVVFRNKIPLVILAVVKEGADSLHIVAYLHIRHACIAAGVKD